MFDHVAHSFIATLQFEEIPINTLDSMTTGPVVITSLKGVPEFTRRLTLPAIDLIHLSHAFHKTIEEILFHYFHPLFSARSCAF